MSTSDISEGTREMVDLSAEAISSLGHHLSQIGQIFVKGALPPPRGDKGTAKKIGDKLELYKAYSNEVERRRKELEQKMQEDFETLRQWRKTAGTEGADMVKEMEMLYHKCRSQDKRIKDLTDNLTSSQEKVGELIALGELKDRKWASLSEAFVSSKEQYKDEVFRRAGVSSWLQFSFDEIRFKWKASEEKEKLRIEHHQKMRKARAQARLDVISRERTRRVLQACVLAFQEEAVEGRQQKQQDMLRQRQNDELLVMGAQLAQALGDEEKAKALFNEQVRRLDEARTAQAEAERQAKIAQREAREARQDAEKARKERDEANRLREEAEAACAKAIAEKIEAEANAAEARMLQQLAEQSRLKAEAQQRIAEEQVRKRQKKIQSLQRMLAELGAESDSDAPPDERAPAFFVNEDGTKVPRPRTRKERMGMAYREAETARAELRIGMAAMIDKDELNRVVIESLKSQLCTSMAEVKEVRWANRVLTDDNSEINLRAQRAEAATRQAEARIVWFEDEVTKKDKELIRTASTISRPSTSASVLYSSFEDMDASRSQLLLRPLAASTAAVSRFDSSRPVFHPATADTRSPRLLLKSQSQSVLMPPLHGFPGSPQAEMQMAQTMSPLAPLRKLRRPPADWRLGWH